LDFLDLKEMEFLLKMGKRKRNMIDILKEEESDDDRASAHFVGREMARVAEPRTKATLINILEREAASSNGHRIAMDVLRQDMFQKLTYEEVASYFNALLRGLTD
jgi:hypothetical protein